MTRITVSFVIDETLVDVPAMEVNSAQSRANFSKLLSEAGVISGDPEDGEYVEHITMARCGDVC